MKYVGYYDLDSNKNENRHYVLSARNKMDYIVDVISKSTDVEIVSASGVKAGKTASAKVININDKVKLRLFKSIGRKNKLVSVLSNLYLKLQLLFYLMKNTSVGESIIVYHSLGYCGLIGFLKKIKRFRLILEVEEIYGDVSGSESDRLNEFKLFNCADAFIFPTQLLDETVNPNGKPSVIIHGTYKVETDRQCNVFEAEDRDSVEKNIHCVYAGTFDPRKGGAVVAAASAQYLPENYHIHILGFGSDDETENMKKIIDETAKCSAAKVTYDGLLSGEDYVRFIQSCDIGLSTQEPTAAFNSTSFPSKILSYMANGLRVVSIRIPAIEKSAVGSELYFYDEQTPEQIAEAIMNIDVYAQYDSRAFIEQLDISVRENIHKILV